MTNKRFLSTFTLIFLLFFVVFGNIGCGGGNNNSKFIDNETKKDNSFTVIFDSNGGSYVPSQTVSSGERAVKPTDPIRKGYIFLGWYIDYELTEQFTFTIPITQSTTLYAKWEVASTPITKYRVTFDSNGGSLVPIQTIEQGEKANKPTNPTRDGYSFEGWYLDSSLTELFDFDSAIINNITLYAKWISSSTPTPTPSSYTIDFDSNGGTEVASQIISPDEVIIKPDEPYKEGFTFMGWYDLEGHMFNFGTSIDHDVILTAEWEQTVSATYEETTELQKKHEYEGIDTISLDKSGPLTGVEIQYKTDGFALISVSELLEDPILNAPGLIGHPIEISHVGGSVKEAMITFYYDPSALSSDANKLGIVYYDEAYRELRFLDEDSTVDTVNNAVYVVTRHFSRYGVVDREEWQKAWDKVLPKSKRKNTGKDKDTQDVYLVFDCSSHITREAMYIAQKSAQNLIDTLSVGDNVVVISLANSFQYTAYGTIADTKSTQNGISYVSKSDIKNAISSIMPIWNAQSKLKNLNNLIVMYVSPPAGSTVCLLSDGDFGTGYIIEGNLQKYNKEGTKFITVCAGDIKDDTVMKHIAEATGGVYIHAETEQTFEDKFPETDIYARLKELSDSDGDSFFDIAETQGMRDQYGEHIKTEPSKADTDGDGISDDIEMGEYHESTGLGNSDHFKRDSDPRVYTVKSTLANVDLSANNAWVDMKRVIDTKTKRIILAASIADRRQVHIGNDKECIYVPSENLKVEVSSFNSNYSIIGDLLVEATEINDGRTYSTYHVFVTLSYKNYPSKNDTITWRITADNLARPGTTDERIEYIEDESPILGLDDPVNDHNLVTRLKAWRAVLEKEFIEKLCADAQQASQNADNDAELKQRKDALLKHMKQYGGGSVPDEVCEAFALAVLDTYDSDGSKVEKYSKNIEELTKQLLNQIASSVKSGEKEVVVGGHIYRINFTFMGMEGTEVDFAYVYRDGNLYTTLVWTTSMAEMKEALALYCAKLAELHKDVWNDFLVSYVYDALQEIGVDVTKDTVEKIFDFTENTIKGLCGDKGAANEVVDELVGAAKEKLKSRLFGDNKFLKFVEENFPKGPTLVKTAEKLNMLREKYDDFNAAMTRYSIASIFGAGDGSDLLNTFEAFKTVYNEINEENLLNKLESHPLTSWPATW